MPIAGREHLFVCATVVIFVAALFISGRTQAATFPDTPGYLAVAPYPDFYMQSRLPFYGWIVHMLGGERFSFLPVVWLQVMLHAGSAVLLYLAVRRLGAGTGAAASLFLAALFSQAFIIFGTGILPESPSVSLALIAVAATLLASTGTRWRTCLLLAGVSGAAACLLRPTCLPLLVALPALFVTAARIRERRVGALRVGFLILTLTLPLLLYMGDRARHTGDFKLTAFGGFQMSGMAALLLSPEIVQRFPPDERELASRILTVREQAESAGHVMRTPINSKGERSVVSAAAGYFDIYARTYDDLLREISKLQLPGESWIAFDRNLQNFSITTVSLAPERYAAWIVGASSRLVGRMIVTNLPFMLASLVWLAALLLLLLRGGPAADLTWTKDMLLLIAVIGTYFIAAAPLAVLMTFPASRYIDSAAVLLPALPLYGAMRLARIGTTRSESI